MSYDLLFAVRLVATLTVPGTSMDVSSVSVKLLLLAAGPASIMLKCSDPGFFSRYTSSAPM